MDSGGVPPLPSELEDFKLLISSGRKRVGGGVQRFVKKVYIPFVELPAEQNCRSALNLVDRGLISQFSSLYPSPKATDGWVQRNWRPLVSADIRSHFIGWGFFVFVFDSAEDRALIFRNGPYFMGP